VKARKKKLLLLNEMYGVISKIKNDPRINRVGRLINKTSLESIPSSKRIVRGYEPDVLAHTGPRESHL
jgi:lipopolysaccharide/colanic/teichoic acid biosynthesis glycosyltransferase